MAHDEYTQLLGWYQRCDLDYERVYIALYISYNTWYSQLLHTTNDRQALVALKKRYIIWDEYNRGFVLKGMTEYMAQLSEMTQREPFEGTAKYWNGEISSTKDWHSLIEYWYYIRCRLMHGAPVERVSVMLAYETLKLFMDEVIERIQRHYGIGNLVWGVDMIRSTDIRGIY